VLVVAPAVDEVALVVFVSVEREVGRVHVSRRTFIAAATAERRGHDPDVHVVQRWKFGAAGGAVAGQIGYSEHPARTVDAVGGDQAGDHVRDGLGEELLLVSHRPRVVDHEKEVDLVDGPGARRGVDECVGRAVARGRTPVHGRG